MSRREAYGERGLSQVDRLGVWLSLRAVRRSVDWTCRPRVLDLGCGYDATLLRALRPRIASGVGIDVSVAPSARAEDGLVFLEGTIEERLPELGDVAFELVLAINVVEHLWDPQAVLRECYRVLAPRGALAVNVPTWVGKPFLEVSAFRLGASPPAEIDDHKMYYGRRDLWPLLVRAGFAPSRIRLRYHKAGLNLLATAKR